MTVRSSKAPAELRPFIVLAAVSSGVVALSIGTGAPLDGHLVFSVLQYFATLAPVALGLGLTMIAGEYDLSVGSVLGLAGCVAVMTGVVHPIIGLACGLTTGVVCGMVQGTLVVGLRLSSVPVTLGGLMTIGALSYVVTGNQTVSYPDLDIARTVNAPLLGLMSLRSLVAIACYAAAALVLARTRVGREVAATGSHRAAATTAGVRTGPVLLLVFVTSGALSALSGVLLSYSLASASPAGLTDVLVPATAACIIGGVSLTGGRGTALGVALGVLTLCLLDAGFSVLGTSPFMQNVVLGAVLLAVAVADAPLLTRYVRARSFLPSAD